MREMLGDFQKRRIGSALVARVGHEQGVDTG